MNNITHLAALTNLYREPHRKYHDLTHIAQMFDMARVARIELSEVQTLAIWYHDAIYKPDRADNEERSAALAREHLSGILSEENLSSVETIIMDTKTHTPSIPDSQVVLDLDMSILGANPDSYRMYMRLIRREYIALPYNKYAQARKAVLKEFLARAKRNELYYVLGEILNNDAIENIKMELEVLKDTKDQFIHDN